MIMRLPVIVIALILTGCSVPVKQNTLRDIDVIGERPDRAGSAARLRNETDIREAYAEYLKHASKQDISRINALQRLAQLEFELIDKLSRNKGEHTQGTIAIEDRIFDVTLNRSIEFLEISLRDYPDAPDNDKALYQLARAYDQKGDYEKSLQALKRLVSNYPKSRHFVEAQFRLAEATFSKGEYSRAEDLYTEVLVSRNNKLFKSNARYKRGWARFKQEYYQEAIDDYVQVVEESHFKPYDMLGASDRNQFDEYFRAIGLSFTYLGGASALNDYFKNRAAFPYIYESYAYTSDIFRKQQRFSDAAEIFQHFTQHYPTSSYVPDAALNTLETWKESGFTNMVLSTLDDFYQAYHPQSGYWTRHKPEQKIYERVTTAMREYIVLAASHYHKEFNKTGKAGNFIQAKNWYERYLNSYRAHMQKDNIHYLYAELLHQHKNYPQALQQYELAAYDGDIILNKDAAQASILLATRLHRDSGDATVRQNFLEKLLHYSLLYTRLYPNDVKTPEILAHAAQEAYHAGRFDETISLTESYNAPSYTAKAYLIHLIKAHAYFRQQRFDDAEAAYQALLTNYRIEGKARQEIIDNLALSIYQQASAARQTRPQAATAHYARIIDVGPESDVAATGLYDAIALSIEHEAWPEAIRYIKKFQAAYPHHKHSHDVSKKLSVAYLESNQDIEAASELVKLARSEQDDEYRSAALWKAAELYAAKNETAPAITAFADYVKYYPRPYPQYVEAIAKLIELNSQLTRRQEVDRWRQKLLDTDKRTPADQKTDRSRHLASSAALALAREQHASFTAIKLTAPLKQKLQQKKSLMQEAVNLYGQASSYRVPETATEAVYAIADIYRTFSKSLLESERPGHLNLVELEQYNILLEDQAFPFEEKAIEFYETNLAYVRDGVYDKWIEQSYSRLAELFPARYDREVKMEGYINVLH